MDSLLDLIRILQPKAALFGGGLSAGGRWGLSFRKRDDLLFCWIEQGECLLLRPGRTPVSIKQGDFALIYTCIPFTLASDISVKPIDSEAAVSASKNVRLRLGDGCDNAITLHAGKFLMNKANEGLLADLLPPLIHIKADDSSLERIRLLLKMNEMEVRQPGPASEFIIARHIELILVEILRANRTQMGEQVTGLLAGLADPMTERALAAMHRNVAHNWTIGELAKLCHVSRSTFAAKFRLIVGVAPMAYLLNWRMALAKDELSRGTKSVSDIAFAIGYQSGSAFTTAFTRATGCSPGRFAGQVAG